MNIQDPWELFCNDPMFNCMCVYAWYFPIENIIFSITSYRLNIVNLKKDLIEILVYCHISRQMAVYNLMT